MDAKASRCTTSHHTTSHLLCLTLSLQHRLPIHTHSLLTDRVGSNAWRHNQGDTVGVKCVVLHCQMTTRNGDEDEVNVTVSTVQLPPPPPPPVVSGLGGKETGHPHVIPLT
ncbi:unnamed protein product [Hydatigera taeniaeformis]|uniref:Uncharacterized protein n=1 Tax=Hydatigena taeniaeformis TaxID=6205 RepID=A0A0R3WR08_HYDTA|nr:unnamed protein product [Hydatigera taeniaeformis]